MRVRIYRPAKSAMQSCRASGQHWVIEPIFVSPREVEPVMGWTKANDPLASLLKRLTFATSGEALTFVRRRGWDYQLEIPNERRFVPKNYLDNFNPDRRRTGR
ncbi:MAG: ETC complex I subunit [Alphaproteobacteria bacterium]|nr:ETC complex I subunit [Alphaproteobacteria bacterium]